MAIGKIPYALPPSKLDPPDKLIVETSNAKRGAEMNAISTRKPNGTTLYLSSSENLKTPSKIYNNFIVP
jgi:hypothetical protein